MKRKILWIILGEVMFFAALGLTLYPVISNYVNKRYASEIYTAYREAIAQTDDTILEQERGRAVAYNQAMWRFRKSPSAYQFTMAPATAFFAKVWDTCWEALCPLEEEAPTAYSPVTAEWPARPCLLIWSSWK